LEESLQKYFANQQAIHESVSSFVSHVLVVVDNFEKRIKKLEKTMSRYEKFLTSIDTRRKDKTVI